ncbi:hypothetical protein [Devosia sp. A449]
MLYILNAKKFGDKNYGLMFAEVAVFILSAAKAILPRRLGMKADQ